MLQGSLDYRGPWTLLLLFYWLDILSSLGYLSGFPDFLSRPFKTFLGLLMTFLQVPALLLKFLYSSNVSLDYSIFGPWISLLGSWTTVLSWVPEHLFQATDSYLGPEFLA